MMGVDEMSDEEAAAMLRLAAAKQAEEEATRRVTMAEMKLGN